MRIFAILTAACLSSQAANAATYYMDFTTGPLARIAGTGPASISSSVYHLAYDEMAPFRVSVVSAETDPALGILLPISFENVGSTFGPDGSPLTWNLDGGVEVTKDTSGLAFVPRFSDGEVAAAKLLNIEGLTVSDLGTYAGGTWSWKITSVDRTSPVPIPASVVLLIGAIAGLFVTQWGSSVRFQPVVD